MRPPFSIQAVSASHFKGDTLPEGLEILYKEELYEDPRTGRIQNLKWEEYVLPELGPTRILRQELGKPIVLPIKNRNFEIRFGNREEEDDCGAPAPAEITFVETTSPETPYEIWDPKKALREMVRDLKADIEEAESLREISDGDEGFLTKLYFRLFELEKDLAEGRTYHPVGTVAFGQPHFIQNSVAPEYKGRSASHLLTLDTYWGDCGNENYMVVLDDEGYPIALFHEASCS